MGGGERTKSGSRQYTRAILPSFGPHRCVKPYCCLFVCIEFLLRSDRRCQTKRESVLDVVIMMRMTFASFKQFLLKVDMSVMRAFVTMVERKGCHGGETEMMPRQHSDDHVAHGDTGCRGN